MSLTPDDLDLLSERFATKADLSAALERHPTTEQLEATYPTKAYLEANYPTTAYLEANYPTKQDLAAALEPYATKQDLHELRTHMLVMFEDLKSWRKTLFDAMAARMDALEERTFGTLPHHEERISGLELRVTRLEQPRRRKQ